MIIRPEQMERIQAAVFDRFVVSMMVHLRRRFTPRVGTMDDPELREFVEHGIRRARIHGVEEETDIRRYLECMVIHGRDYDTAPGTEWAGNILRDGGLSGTMKMVYVIDQGMFAAAE